MENIEMYLYLFKQLVWVSKPQEVILVSIHSVRYITDNLDLRI